MNNTETIPYKHTCTLKRESANWSNVSLDYLYEVGQVFEDTNAHFVKVVQEHVKHWEKVAAGNVFANDQRQFVNWVR